MISAAPYNAQRTKESQRFLTWTDFYNDPFGAPSNEGDGMSDEDILNKLLALMPPPVQ